MKSNPMVAVSPETVKPLRECSLAELREAISQEVRRALEDEDRDALEALARTLDRVVADIDLERSAR